MAYKSDNCDNSYGNNYIVMSTLGTDWKQALPSLFSSRDDKDNADNSGFSDWACSVAAKQHTRRPKVQVCPINVGQGDAILLKLKYEQGREYNCLVDCGQTKYYSDVKRCMRKYGVLKGERVQLHGIIVTHPDSHHLGGIKMLLEQYGQKILNTSDVVITRAFFWRYYKDEMSKKFVNLINKTKSRREDIKVSTCVTGGLLCHFPTEIGCVFRHAQQKGRYVKHSFTKPKGINANKASILTTLNKSKRKCDVVLTGDLIAERIMPQVRSKTIGIFQVPHHGDFWMSRLETQSSYYVQTCSTEIKEMFEKCSQKVKETLLFYSTFRAKCYIISAGGTKNHPQSSVLQGIILANSLRREECVILLTNSRGLDSEKLEHLHHLAPQWTRYVKIYHYDDVFFTEQCHTMIRPERCISDVRTSTIEWTPEGYVNSIRIKLKTAIQKMCKRRPLGNKFFVEKLLVQLTIKKKKVTAHIVCVPLPHNPKSNNCCYVIEESIASGAHFSQALFLRTADIKRKRQLLRAKSHVLFQYISNEWEKRELTVTVQDHSPTSPIPYNSINLQPSDYAPLFSSVCFICSEDIITQRDKVSCHHHGCLSCTHAQCVGHTRSKREPTTFVCSNHTTCCLCGKDIIRVHGTVSCNQQHLGCLNQAHARCAGYRRRQASRVTTFACPSHKCCLCQTDITKDDNAVPCTQQHQGCLNRAHTLCARGYSKREATFTCPSHTCCLCKKDIAQDCEVVSCRQRCLNRAHAQCAGYSKREARQATTFACPRHSCCLCEREIVKDYGTVSCKQHFSDQGCLNRAHAQCAGYKVRSANRVKRFSCPSCRY